MKAYSFVTVWKLKNTSLDAVWKTIKAVDDWPQWWKGVITVHTEKEGDANDIGKISLLTFRSVLPYNLSFRSELIQLKHHQLMVGKAEGELEGTGIWTFSVEQEIVRVQYNWDVTTNKPWMNFFAPLLRPAFKWNHDAVMKRGQKGLAKWLQATIVP